jgi:Mce-associated membrane protein
VTSAAAARSVLGAVQRRLTAVLTALAALAVGLAGWFGVSWYRAAQDGSLASGIARDAVLQDAEQATINLNTLDYRRVQDGLTLWEQSATGSLLDEVRANRATYAQVITDSKTATTARTLDGAVAELDEHAGTARVLVGVDVTAVRDSGQASCVRRRIQLEMRRSGAGVPQGSGAGVPQGSGVAAATVWKAEKLAPVGAANPVPGACPSVQPPTSKPGPPR